MVATSEVKHDHAEAFRLMKYLCENCKRVEWIWNSRDGVTPFIVGCRQCDGAMQHVEWQHDPYIPTFKPEVGSRMFVDLSPERAVEFVKQKIEAWWDDAKCPMSKMFESKTEAEQRLLAGDEYKSHQPDLVVVESGAP